MGPRNAKATVLSLEEEAIMLAFFKQLLLLDDYLIRLSPPFRT
jgi:hypothetical protein